MIHPKTEVRFISKEKGNGVVATAFIPRGTITWIGDPLDQVFKPEEIESMHPVFRDIVDTYAFRDNKGDFVLCWDHSRFVNHSFNSNCLSTPYNFELAVRDIFPGEELTNDYGYLNLAEPFDCIPEPGSKRTRVMPDDLLRHYPEWDSQLQEAFKSYNKVSQPLAKFIEPQYRDKVSLIVAGKAQMDSILNCYYDEQKRRMAA